MLGGRAGDAIGSREDFKQMAVRVVEVDTAAIVSMVDGAGVPARRISPIVKAAC
jgi:major membrane immunogen (membrane-anchored lipoprotein)